VLRRRRVDIFSVHLANPAVRSAVYGHPEFAAGLSDMNVEIAAFEAKPAKA
jgi:hypothetical protein